MLTLEGIEKLKNNKSRSINPENPTGATGAGGKEGSDLGPSRKGRPMIHLKRGETVTLAEIDGPGTIRHIWMTVTDATVHGSFVLRDIVLRMYWDDEETPSVEAPLGDFFCNGFGTRCDVNSMPIVVNPSGAMNCYFPMPFRKKARIVVTNEHEGDIDAFFYTINYTVEDDIDDDTAYFHAQWRREKYTQEAKDYTVVSDIRGKGHYVGTYLALTALERYWWGEGEFKFYIDDDEQYPTICGTGTEDYFGGAWAFHKKHEDGIIRSSTYNTPFLGYAFQSTEDHTRDNFPKKDSIPTHGFGKDALPMHGLYRWHLPDPIRFDEKLTVTLQQIGNDDIKLFERADDISSVAYWYQTMPHQPFPKLPGTKERRPR
ncbi:glycoside hydrolase family 172 protein [Oceanobacillus timonensis]|uniref:glycoside hydrolase family 172 protein n=1 Tax=Oceanobacillus timonensis TaxID=1926285 RepID=UPI0009B9C0CE|nr:glycoside hydrolase family 172 protein [Oceanobacillus timonensis]